MKFSIIVCINNKLTIGKDNGLLYHIKTDLRNFKSLTTDNVIICGRKTYESLPKILPGRKNIVISTTNIKNGEIEVYKSIRDFLVEYQNSNDEIFIIGGASIYKAFIDLASKMYLTQIDSEEINADVYFPKFDISDWNKEIISNHEENNIKYSHVLYKRK